MNLMDIGQEIDGSWLEVQRLLDPVTFNKIILVTGDDQIGSPCNAKELRKYITKESLPEHSWPMYQDL